MLIPGRERHVFLRFAKPVPIEGLRGRNRDQHEEIHAAEQTVPPQSQEEERRNLREVEDRHPGRHRRALITAIVVRKIREEEDLGRGGRERGKENREDRHGLEKSEGGGPEEDGRAGGRDDPELDHAFGERVEAPAPEDRCTDPGRDGGAAADLDDVRVFGDVLEEVLDGSEHGAAYGSEGEVLDEGLELSPESLLLLVRGDVVGVLTRLRHRAPGKTDQHSDDPAPERELVRLPFEEEQPHHRENGHELENEGQGPEAAPAG